MNYFLIFLSNFCLLLTMGIGILVACQSPPPDEIQLTSIIPSVATTTRSAKGQDAPPAFAWLPNGYLPTNALHKRVAPPSGFQRAAVEGGGFGDWLRKLPLKTGKPPVLLYNGQQKDNQTAHEAVLDIDVGAANLQQCADAVMRLRAEYLFNKKKYNEIHFNFTSGQAAHYEQWKNGYRPVVNGNKVTWLKKAKLDNSYTSFKQYLNSVFNYCGTHSLSKELKPVTDVGQIAVGDVFIHGGFPGHAVLVMDVAENPQTGEKLFLLAQSYMPAQQIHLLVNPNDNAISPWYRLKKTDKLLKTPEWTFQMSDLMRF